MVVFQAVAWEGKDSDDNSYIIKIFGRTQEGKSVCLSTKFRPYFFVKSREGAQKFMKEPVVHAASVKGKELWGFTNNEECVFVKLDFHTLKEMKDQERILKRTYQVYESNIDPVLRFMHRTNISSTGWLDSGPECERAYISTCDIDLWCNNWKTLTPVSRDDIAPLRIMSFDIEAYSHDGGFPDPEHPDNVVFQIGMTIKVYGQEGWFDRKCLCLKQTDSQDCESFEKEEDLLEAFAKYLIKTDPDIITGYNIFGFDLEFLMKRMRILPVTPTACFWTRLKNRSVQLVEKTLSSSALGSNQLKMVPMVGRYVFDLFQDIKREHKLESYSLNSVSKHFLKDQKNDMPVREIFRRYKDGDPSELGEVAAYCIKDTELPHALMKKLFTVENLIEMAKATWVPLSYLSERGQQIKVYSQLSRKARELGFMIPVMQIKGTDDKYQGATVLEAQTGAYYGPITALDFASLYPSIMCAHNLCYSTMVMNPKYDNLPGVTYEQFGQYRFAQTLRVEGGAILPVPSLLPAILTELKQFRKKAKKLMAQSEGTPMYGVYNGQQLAYKISMNSVYGFTGASKGMLPLLAIASTVTMRGRQMIEETKNYVEANFPGAKVRYGDSVMPGTPVLVRENGIVKMKSIDELSSPACWEAYPGFWRKGTDKNSLEIYNTDAWTHQGWQPIKRVIRHKCQKKIYRVLTHTGLVDVTEDHSLLTPNLELVKPGEVWEGRKLFHSWPDDISSWSGRPDGLEVNFGGEYDPFFKLFDTKESLQAKYPKKQCFLLTRKDAQIVYMKLIKLGYNVSLNVNPDNNAVQINWTESSFRRDPEAIKKIEVLHESWDGYVYDLETASGTFQAGIGRMIVKNTDSVMVEFDVGGRTGQEAIDYSWQLGEQASEQCTKLFKEPNELELEKIYCPYFLYSKKRYAAKMYEKKGDDVVFKKIDVKGLQVVRRDNCPYVREVCKDILETILETSDPLPSIEKARKAAKDLKAGLVPMEKLLMSKQLGADYKSKSLAHVSVVQKMRERVPGSEPQQGDRVPFVIVQGPKNAKMFERAEDPQYVREHNLKLDLDYYFENQLKNPVCDLLEPLVGDTRVIFERPTRKITDFFSK